MKHLMLAIAIFLWVPGIAIADESAFCNDQAQWEHFNKMVADLPDDIPLQILHALKIGLCVKIQQGTISTGAAITLFNDMLDTVANKRGDDAEQEKAQKEEEL